MSISSTYYDKFRHKDTHTLLDALTLNPNDNHSSNSGNTYVPMPSSNTEYPFCKLVTKINKYGTISPDVEEYLPTPKLIRIPLKVHQQKSLFHLNEQEEMPLRYTNIFNINIFSDTVGSGKSLSLLSLIAHKRCTQFSSNQFYSSFDPTNSGNSFHSIYGSNYQLTYGLIPGKESIELKTNLIIVPHNVFNQWKKYIIEQTQLTFLELGNNKTITSIENIEDLADKYSIFLIKSTMYKEFVKHVNNLTDKKNSQISVMNKRYFETIPGLGKLEQINNIVDDDSISRSSIIDNLGLVYNKYKSMFNALENRLCISNSHSLGIDEVDELKNNIRSIKIDLEKVIDSINHENMNKKNLIKTVPITYSITGYYFQRVIIDEVDSIKIPNFPYSLAKQTWFVTSSINNILYPFGRKKWCNDTCKYHVISSGIKGTGWVRCALMDMIPNFKYTNNVGVNYYSYTVNRLHNYRIMYKLVRNDKEFIKKSIDIPKPKCQYIQCYTPPHLYAIQGAISVQALNALNAGDTSKAIELLGCNESTEDQLVDHITKKLETKKNEYQKKRSQKQDDLVMLQDNLSKLNNGTDNILVNTENSKLSDNYTNDKDQLKIKIDSTKASIKNIDKNLLDIDNKLNGIHLRLSNISNKKCDICSENIQAPSITPCCKNVFCFECLTTSVSISQACPFCNTKININTINVIVDKKNNSFNNKMDSLPNKIDALINLISDKNKRYIVFSEYEGGISKIESKLIDNNIEFKELKGSSDVISKIINDYREKKVNVLLLNAKHCGAGLNLQSTDDIIIYHRMAKDLENQVIGRAQRIGRNSALNIIYLCYDNEYVNDY